MYSVLIVDDEEPVLESYSYLIDTGLDDFKVGGTARSGTEAIKAAHRNRPDVVLMDIAMPGIDGIDTIRELQHEFPDALYILSTAYERFDLAQRAIPLRVFAYLVKPVSRKRFIETMFQAKEELDDRQERADARLAQQDEYTLSHDIEDFMLQLTWKPFEEAAWLRFRSLFHLPSDYGFVMALKLDRQNLATEIATLVERRFQCIWSERSDYLLLFLPDPADPDVLVDFVKETVSASLGDGSNFTVGTGSRRYYNELYLSSDEALSGISPPADGAEQLAQFRTRLRDFGPALARTLSVGDIVSVYTSVADEAFATWGYPVAKMRIACAFEQLVEDVNQRVAGGQESALSSDPIEEVIGFETRDEVDAWAHRLLRRLVETQSHHAGNSWPTVLRHAVAYIDSHFAEPLQLTDVAEHCSVSPGYLSRLFSEHLSISFNDYLNSVRLDIAQRLLKDDGIPIKEVSYSVGYQDPNYFSRIFRKFKGVSPTEYSRKEPPDG